MIQMTQPYILNTRSDIFNLVPQQLIIGEIGVFKGDFSKIIFDIAKPKELHLIDIFDGITMSGNKDGKDIIYTNLSDEYIALSEYFHINQNVILHKGKSSDVLKTFPNNYFDFLYIDGDHSYEGVYSDLELSLIKVKSQGNIAGHDYNQYSFPGVYNAVNNFCNKYNLRINYLTKDLLPSYVISII